ncbi:Nicotinamide mononucleotide adenylyltransferase [Pseudozyma hubeiensis]|nr:Nicotinamide mononucleotide adenylyltransferase [Pseudozyma hubeiensis]
MTMASNIARAAASAANSNTSGVRLVYSTSSTWPFSSSSSSSSTINIAVLDSSFNPPSRAHLALLLSQPILARPKRTYDGHLLLFSTQNADKGSGKPGDASLSQRVEMMTLMAKDVERIQSASGHPANVAVGLVDKPLIFAKSTLTWDLLKQQQSHDQHTAAAVASPRLHWVVGFDTLYRVFQLKYYPSVQEFQQQCSQFFEQERTTFVCARRDPSSYPQIAADGEEQGGDVEEKARREENKLLESEYVAPWVGKGSIGMLDIDPEQAKMSSTRIRELLKDDSVGEDRRRELLRGLVPPSLVEYLIESRVYRD